MTVRINPIRLYEDLKWLRKFKDKMDTKYVTGEDAHISTICMHLDWAAQELERLYGIEESLNTIHRNMEWGNEDG